MKLSGGNGKRAETGAKRAAPGPLSFRGPNRRILIVIAVLLFVVGTIVVLISVIVRPPSLPVAPTGDPAIRGPEVSPDGTDEPNLEDLAPGVPPDLTSEDRRPGVYTVLIFGNDGDDLNCDTIMIATLDTKARKLGVVSVPRDTMVECRRSVKKINGAFAVGGVSNFKKELRQVLGFTPDFYIRINLESFIEIVDAIGGVEFYVPMDMNYDDADQDLHIHYKEGLQPLNGQQAMEVLRYRQDSQKIPGTNILPGYSDIRRTQVQQEFIMAVAKKMLTFQNIFKVQEYINIYYENVETDLEVGNLIWFAMQAYDIGVNKFEMKTLPTYSYRYNLQDYEVLKSAEALAMINELINPRTRDVSAADVRHIKYTQPTATPKPESRATKPPETPPPDASEGPLETPVVWPPPTPTSAPPPSSPPPSGGGTLPEDDMAVPSM
ncbi:LCP family protein [Oscillospiraceae bacterium OttesenSCG-928-G22]|nr:LCP family protein [Oscillospiraceae bacterium OttesenSCG-928-G22]